MRQKISKDLPVSIEVTQNIASGSIALLADQPEGRAGTTTPSKFSKSVTALHAIGVGVGPGVWVGPGVGLGVGDGVGVPVGPGVPVGVGVATGVHVSTTLSIRQPACETLVSLPMRQRNTTV